MTSNKKTNTLKAASLIIALLLNQEASATSFTISGASTTPQTLDDGETGLIQTGGSLTTSSTAVTLDNSTSAQFTNNGTITSNNLLYVILESGSSNIIINNGSIFAANNFIDGINSSGSGTTITNNGNITLSGNASTGVALWNSSGTTILNNSGKIIATGNGSFAITGADGDQTVILNKGSEIIGAVNLGNGTDSLTVTGLAGNGISGRIATSNVESLSISGNLAGVVVGNDIYTIDPTGAAMLSVGVNKLALNIQNSINSHNSQASLNKAKSPTWINLFNSNFDRQADSGNLAYRNQTSGFVGGYDLDSKSSAGLVFGVSSGNMKTKSTSFKTDVTSVFVGGYKNFDLATSTSLNFNLIAGYERYSSHRNLIDNINGYQIAKSDFNNFFLSPSATLEHKFKITESFALSPMAKLSYTSSFFGESDEKESTASNITTKSRQVQIFNSRIGINSILTLKNAKFELGTGFDSRVIKEGQVKANVSNTNFSYNTNNDKNVNGHYVRAAAYIIDLKDFSLVGSFEKRRADGGEREYFTQLGAGYRF